MICEIIYEGESGIDRTVRRSLYLSQSIKNTKIVIYLPELGCASCYEMQLQFYNQQFPLILNRKFLLWGSFLVIVSRNFLKRRVVSQHIE